MRHATRLAMLSLVSLASFASLGSVANQSHAADLTSFQWPWQASSTYSDIPTYDWSGGYGALMGGYSSSSITAGDLAANLVDQSIPSWKYREQARDLAKNSVSDMTGNAAVYSLHAGFNIMAQRLVYGAELEYGRFAPTITSSDSFQQSRVIEEVASTDTLGRSIVEAKGVRLAYQNKTEIQDFALINARAGYAYGRFMPYALVGLGVTRVKINASMQANETSTIFVDRVYSASMSSISNAPLAVLTKDAYAATVSLGLGFEYALLDHLVLRAQYNYMTTGNVKGEGAMSNIARGGLALKF